jgi:hypothetical protein
VTVYNGVTVIFSGQYLNVLDACNFQPISDPGSGTLHIICMLGQT